MCWLLFFVYVCFVAGDPTVKRYYGGNPNNWFKFATIF